MWAPSSLGTFGLDWVATLRTRQARRDSTQIAFGDMDIEVSKSESREVLIGGNSEGLPRLRRVFLIVAIGLLLFAAVALATLPKIGNILCLVLLVTVGGIAFSYYLVNELLVPLRIDNEMHEVGAAIKDGAEGFLRVQYGAIAKMSLLTAVVLFAIYLVRPTTTNEELNSLALASVTVIAFLLGAFCSAAAGYMGVWVSVRANMLVAARATAGSYPKALLAAFRGGAFSSVLSASLCIGGISVLYIVIHIVMASSGMVKPSHIPMMLSGYGFGASFVALFMQLGGGIYTKAADVGADMVGKVEASIPEDDPRNPAVIADLVGDNVGDCAGSMADVFESIAAEIIGTMILGSALAVENGVEDSLKFVCFPLVVHAFDIIVSAIGILSVRPKENEEPLTVMKRGYAVAMVFAIVLFVVTTSGCGGIGIVMSYILILITQYYTDYKYNPVKSIAAAGTTGHGTNIIAGLSVGLESTGPPAVAIAVALLGAHALGSMSGLSGGNAGLFGMAAATMGMLCTAVFILSMNNFGPIADNAGGLVEMSGKAEEVRSITDKLDAVGNVTKAATKGYAVGGSALATFVLFRAYLDEVSAWIGRPFEVVNLAKVEVIIGGLLGITLVLVFTGWAMAAVGRAAQAVVQEVRRQFRDRPGILTGTEKPCYTTCVAIVTKAALMEMRRPAILALALPVVTGLFFRVVGSFTGDPLLGTEAVAAFLLFASLTGLLMAVFLDNSGGAWDNAKKLVESGAYGGKGSEAHKACVTGDTVGDPCKDTAGPSLHVIMTTMSTTALVLGPLFINNL